MGGGGLSRERAAKVEQPPRQGDVGRAAPPHAAAVVGDLEGATLVVVQSAAWTGNRM